MIEMKSKILTEVNQKGKGGGHINIHVVRATLPYCSQRDSASLFGQTSPTNHFW